MPRWQLRRQCAVSSAGVTAVRRYPRWGGLQGRGAHLAEGSIVRQCCSTVHPRLHESDVHHSIVVSHNQYAALLGRVSMFDEVLVRLMKATAVRPSPLPYGQTAFRRGRWAISDQSGVFSSASSSPSAWSGCRGAFERRLSGSASGSWSGSYEWAGPSVLFMNMGIAKIVSVKHLRCPVLELDMPPSQSSRCTRTDRAHRRVRSDGRHDYSFSTREFPPVKKTGAIANSRARNSRARREFFPRSGIPMSGTAHLRSTTT
jgi:hypothetical protein